MSLKPKFWNADKIVSSFTTLISLTLKYKLKKSED
jgi:hypothetical protein